MVMEIFGATVLYGDALMVTIGVAIGVTLLSSLLHRKVVDKKRMDEIRGRIEKHQKDYMEANKANDTKKVAQLDKEQAEIMGLVKENMMASMKPTLVTMPVVLILIWLMGSWYGSLGPIIDLPFGLPMLTHAAEEIGVINGVDWFGMYIMSAISTALFLELVLRRIFKI